jgi:large subunit ribosomal protein L3
VTQIKSPKKDGYIAIQIGYKLIKRNKKPEIGHLEKVGAPPLRYLREYKVRNLSVFELGQSLQISKLFQEGDIVDVSGISIGKGFQGGIKRWNMHRGFMTHGSKSHRAPGSIGMRYSGNGGRVMPGSRMAGRKGNRRVTIQKLTVIKIVTTLNVIVIKGSVPGKSGSLLHITAAKTIA